MSEIPNIFFLFFLRKRTKPRTNRVSSSEESFGLPSENRVNPSPPPLLSSKILVCSCLVWSGEDQLEACAKFWLRPRLIGVYWIIECEKERQWESWPFFFFFFFFLSVNVFLTELKNNSSGGQSVKIETTSRQCVNGPNHKWVKCIFPKKNKKTAAASEQVFEFVFWVLMQFCQEFLGIANLKHQW